MKIGRLLNLKRFIQEDHTNARGHIYIAICGLPLLNQTINNSDVFYKLN